MKNPLLFIIIYAIIVILATVFEIYLCVDVITSIINGTKTTLQLTIDICTILIGIPLCTGLLYYVLMWIASLFK